MNRASETVIIDDLVLEEKNLTSEEKDSKTNVRRINSISKIKSKKWNLLICGNRKKIIVFVIVPLVTLTIISACLSIYLHNSGTRCTDTSCIQANVSVEFEKKYCGYINKDTQVNLACDHGNKQRWLLIKDSSSYERNYLKTCLYFLPSGVSTLRVNFNASSNIYKINLFSSNNIKFDGEPIFRDQNHLTFVAKDFFQKNSAVYLMIESEIEALRFLSLVFEVEILYGPLNSKLKAYRQTSPKLLNVEDHQYNRCSLEYVEGSKFHCDWWKFAPNNENFGELLLKESTNSKLCLNRGVISKPLGAKFFMLLSGDFKRKSKITKAYLISPLFRATDSRVVILSFYHTIICTNTSIRVYLVPKDSDYIRSVSNSKPLVQFTKPSFTWTFDKVTCNIPENFNDFHLIIEAVVTNHEICSSYDVCSLNSTVAIDEINVETKLVPCCKSNEKSLIDVDFSNQSSNGWRLRDWKIVNDIYSTHDQFVSLLFADAETEDTYFKSPLVSSTKNCSCTVQFDYLAKSLYVETVMSLIQKFGKYQTENFEHQKTLWSKKISKINTNWQTVKIDIKSVDKEIFYFEFQAIVKKNVEVYILLDNISFLNCDFQLYRP